DSSAQPGVSQRFESAIVLPHGRWSLDERYRSADTRCCAVPTPARTANAFPSCGWITGPSIVSLNAPTLASQKAAPYARVVGASMSVHAFASPVWPSQVAIRAARRIARTYCALKYATVVPRRGTYA